jgi:putative nucleotidyltransferase-like protein
MSSAAAQPVAFYGSSTTGAPGCAHSPEFDLLLACCSDSLKQEQTDRVPEALSRQLDWDRVLKLAEHHGVIPHVYVRLSSTPGLVPVPALDRLRQPYEANARQGLWLTRELLRILEHLKARGIAALPYKGPALAEFLYGNILQRQFGDLDILVHTPDVAPAKAAVRELGYEHSLALTPKQEQSYLQSGYEYTFDSPHGRNLLEIQWQVLPRFYAVDFDMDGLFERAQSLTLSGHTLQTLGMEDLVLVLCAHAAKHAWIQLSWLCDLARLVQAKPVRWEVVQKQAECLGIERIVKASFLLAHKLLGVEIPAALQAQGNQAEFVAARVLPILCGGEEINPESIPYFKLMLESREHRSDRLRFLWRLAVTPGIGEWTAVRLPPPLFPLYRGVRAFRLAARLFAG